VMLWDTDARSFGVVRSDNFALFINLILCVVGILTMLFSTEVVEREGLPPGEFYALTLFGLSGMMLMAAATDLLVIFLALLWVIGTPGRVYSGVLILMALAMVLMIVSAKYRFQRLTGYLADQGSATGANMQAIQGKYAVGSGGWFGVGLGASGGKWGWVPESTTDFIFAIIGEELGLVGTLCVTILYGGLAFAGLRIARRVPDMFCRLGATAITAWIVVQAAINIGAVIGVLPITGVPLPLVSAGLSSLLVTLVGLGMLMSFARLEPGAREALAARGPGWPRRVLSWLGLSKHRK